MRRSNPRAYGDARTCAHAARGARYPAMTAHFPAAQMAERELEVAMLDFYRQRFNVLLCTTIIESGIDVPSANTIIIHRADKFGLSQLHQLRGRVGRSHHRAYAYLVVPERKAMTPDAEKRIEQLLSEDGKTAPLKLSETESAATSSPSAPKAPARKSAAADDEDVPF